MKCAYCGEEVSQYPYPSCSNERKGKRDGFLEHLAFAKKIVEGWPSWKRGFLLESNVGVNPHPRPPVGIPVDF